MPYTGFLQESAPGTTLNRFAKQMDAHVNRSLAIRNVVMGKTASLVEKDISLNTIGALYNEVSFFLCWMSVCTICLFCGKFILNSPFLKILSIYIYLFFLYFIFSLLVYFSIILFLSFFILLGGVGGEGCTVMRNLDVWRIWKV